MFYTVTSHERAVVQCMKAVRPEFINMGPLMDNHCIKQKKAFFIPILKQYICLFNIFCTFVDFNFEVMSITPFLLFHFTNASTCLQMSILCKWRHCLETSSLVSTKIENGRLNISFWVVKYYKAFDFMLFDIYFFYFYFILW